MDHKISINYILCSRALSMCTGIVGCFLLGRNVILNIHQIRSERFEPLGCMKLKFKCVKLIIHNPCLITQNAGDLKSSWRFKVYKKKEDCRIESHWRHGCIIRTLFCVCFVRFRNAPSPSCKQGVASETRKDSQPN